MESIYNLNNFKDKFTQQKLELSNYYWFNEYFSNEDIDKILTITNKYNYQDSKVSNLVDKSYRNNLIKWIPNNDETNWIYKELSELVIKANKIWNFDIVGFGENIQIGEYNSDVKGHYDWHLDIGVQSCCRKISISVQLSDEKEYEGGELEMQFGRNVNIMSKNKGSVFLFPSYMLHRVKPVTKGIRRSLVVWVTGPPFK